MKKHFIRNKLLKMMSSLIFSLASIILAFGGMAYGSHLIETHFIFGAFLIGVSPLVIFKIAFFYQKNVIFPMRQIFIFAPASLNHWQKSIVKSVKKNYGFAQWIPVIITAIAAIEAVAFVPGAITNQIIESSSLTDKIIAGGIISANLLLFFKMTNQIIAAKESLTAQSAQ